MAHHHQKPSNSDLNIILRNHSEPCTGDSKINMNCCKLLKLKSFKTTVVHEFQPLEPANRVNICKELQADVMEGESDSSA
jgi:hypothetical protein